MTAQTINALAAYLCCLSTAAADEPRWFRGNTHTHSLWSDGNGFPEMIAKFYRDKGYQFLVLSDHNVLSRGEKWMPAGSVEKRRKTLGHSTLKKYISTFGEDWVELRGEGDKQEVRLKTLEEIRPKFEKPGEFLCIEGEEITDGFKGKPVHINGINLAELVKPQKGDSVRATIRNNLIAVREQSQRLGKPMLAHLNHPNFGWGVTAEDLAHVIEEEFFEVYNGHPGINHMGDSKHPSDEKIWDIANTIRLSKLGADPLFGIASDDSHTYHGGNVKPGRGWVMVKSEKLSGDAIVKAMQAGDFYASSGVTLKELKRDQEKGELAFEIQPVEGETYTTQIIGTHRGEGGDPGKVGVVLATVEGTSVSYKLGDDEWYIRATITSDKAHPLPSFKGQLKQAWTQPIWVHPGEGE